MIFKLTSKLNDGMAEAPPLLTNNVDDLSGLFREIVGLDALTNDYGVVVPVGATLLIERVE